MNTANSPDVIQSLLSMFFQMNPDSAYTRRGRFGVIGNAWGDKGVQALVSEQDRDLIKALNTVRIPSSRMGIWNSRDRTLETFLPLEFRLRSEQSTWFPDDVPIV